MRLRNEPPISWNSSLIYVIVKREEFTKEAKSLRLHIRSGNYHHHGRTFVQRIAFRRFGEFWLCNFAAFDRTIDRENNLLITRVAALFTSD